MVLLRDKPGLCEELREISDEEMRSILETIAADAAAPEEYPPETD